MGKFTFTPAVRTARGARIALAGPSGSGKTYTALTLATAMGTKVLGADTESKTMSLYADLFRFDKVELDSYDPRDLIELLAEAAAARYDAIVVDSWSHFWSGEAGMLDLVDTMSKGKSGSSFNNGWKAVTPIERDMIKAIKSYPGHVIVTMRTKTEWVIEQNDRGRHEPKKVGLKPDQRADFEYEFDVFATLDRENTLTVEKTRCSLLSGGVYRKPTGEIGVTLRDWLDSGAAAPNAQDIRDQAFEADATVEALRGLYDQARDAGLLGASVLTPEGRAVSLAELLAARAAAVNTPTPPAAPVRELPKAPPSETPSEGPATVDDWRKAIAPAVVDLGWLTPKGFPDLDRTAREYAEFTGEQWGRTTVDNLAAFHAHLQAQIAKRAQNASAAAA